MGKVQPVSRTTGQVTMLKKIMAAIDNNFTYCVKKKKKGVGE